MNNNEPLFDESGELNAQEKAKEQVDAVRSLREYRGPAHDIKAKKLDCIENLVMLFDNEEIDDFDMVDSIREILELK